jgi:DNA-binding transcriptional regulator YiaG
MRGYSQIVIEANQAAENTLGVELGAICIKLKHPVQKVSESLNISRQTVYDWFSGKSKPSKSKHDLVQNLIKEISL